MLKIFHLDRQIDLTGVSGTSNNIASGVIFEDGKCVLRWNTAHPSITIYDSIEQCIAIHSHGDCTKLVFDN
jgi:hypothetical protein